MAELREAEMRGELIRVDAVRSALAGVIVSTRESLLQLPSRLSVTLAAETDTAVVYATLEKEIHQALAQLAASPARLGKADQEAAP